MATRNTNIVAPKLIKPIPGNSTNVWGGMLNENFDKLSEFHTKVIADSEMQNQELARLENEKLNIEDIPSKVEPVVQEFLETTIKPEIDDYIDTVSKPDITSHVENKKQEINTYVNTTSKPALDTYEKEKEKELNTYTTTKKGELDSHTTAKRGELDTYEKTKETQLNNYTGTKQTQLDSYTNTKKGQLDTYTTGKEGELDTHTAEKKSELDTYEETKEGELNTFTSAKKTEITNHTNTKKGELDTYTTQKKGEITTHTDSEIERINADSELANKVDKTVQVIAGNGLVGGGDLSTNRTLNVASADDGITVNADNIKLNIVDNATTDSATRAGSARQIKLLSENKQNKTDSGLQTDSKEIVGAINESLWNIGYKALSTVNDFNELTQSGVFFGRAEVDTLNAPFTPPFNFILINYNRGGLIEQTVITGVDDIVVRRQLGTRWYNWEKTLRTNTKEFLGNAGISSIIYIQDSGTKTQGQGYIDKSTGQVYLCLETNTDTTITNKFMSITNVELGKKIKQNTDDKVDKADIVDNLTTADKSKVLSANMGKYLEDNKQNKTDSRLQTEDKDIVNSINEINLLKGGIIKGVLKIDNSSNNNLYLLRNGVNKGEFDTISNGIMLYNSASKKAIRLFDNGSMELQANNLATNAREVIDAINEEYKLIKGNSGISSIIYIQDTGEKTAGNGYVDKTTGSLYLCKVTTTDTSVTDKFLLATNIENRDRISVIEEKLGIYHPVGKISTISVSRDENSSSPILSFSSL